MFIHDVTCSYTKMFIQEQRMFSSWRTYSYALKIPAGKWTISKTTAPIPTPNHPVTFKTVPREEWGSRLLAAPVGADTLIDHWAVGEPPVTNASSIFNLALKKWSSGSRWNRLQNHPGATMGIYNTVLYLWERCPDDLPVNIVFKSLQGRYDVRALGHRRTELSEGYVN